MELDLKAALLDYLDGLPDVNPDDVFMTEEEWDGSVKSHLKGCFAPTKFASIHWRQERNGGRIIYFTSVAGIRGAAGQPNYSAAQQGKVGLMLSCANALDRYGVTANCISPVASTRMTDRGIGAWESKDEPAVANDEPTLPLLPATVGII